MPYLTPNEDTEGGFDSRPLYIPKEYTPIVTGALLKLADTRNWEEFGDITPQEAVDAMNTMLDLYFEGNPMIGVCLPYATTNIPSNMLPCDGSEFARADYPLLYAVLDAAYIIDADTFRTPNYVDRVPRGTSGSQAVELGEDTHILTVDEIPSHSHDIPYQSCFPTGTMVENCVVGGILTQQTGETGGGGSTQQHASLIRTALGDNLPMTDKTRGYIVPDPIDPESEICIRVYVPNHHLYVAAFMRAYAYFGQWVAWEKDATGKASQAAAVWRESIERTVSEFDCSQGECGIMDIRQSTTTPCFIEKQAGCDGEWEQAVDMRLCVPRMRLFQGRLQQDTTGNGDWVDTTGEETEPYDPRFDDPVTPAWETVPEGETGECLSAANVSEYVNNAVELLADEMIIGNTFFQTLSAAVVILTAVMNLIPLTALTALIFEMFALVIDDWNDIKAYDTRVKLTEILQCKYQTNGVMSSGGWTDALDEITAYRNTLTDPDELARWRIIHVLISLWGPVGMSLLAAIWGIDTYECENVCGNYSHYFDFTAGDQGFVEAVEYDATYTAGVGWGWGDTNNKDRVYIRKSYGFTLAAPYSFKLHLSNGWDCQQSAVTVAPYTTINSGGYGPYYTTDDEWDWGEDAVANDSDHMEIGIECGGDEVSERGHIIGVTIYGHGPDPFA